MNLAVATHDLTKHNSHLMPWRTVCEMVTRLNDQGQKAILLSLSGNASVIEGPSIPPNTVVIEKSRDKLERELRGIIQAYSLEALVWPLMWREPAWRTKLIGRLSIPTVGYFPGGIYDVSDVLYAVRRIGIRASLPYVMECIVPKRGKLQDFKKSGIDNLIAMTAKTAQVICANGWESEQVNVIPPGKDSEQLASEEKPLPPEFAAALVGRSYFLFMGPPSGIRGIYELLEAFDRFADRRTDVCLVCLFRSDRPLEEARIARVMKSMRNSDRVWAKWESVDRDTLTAFVSACHAVVLPFVAVPSEIPLAVIEVMRYGKPVVTTMTGGTGEYVSAFGEVSPLGDISALANSMDKLINNDTYYQACCRKAKENYEKHPLWEQVALGWQTVIKNAIGRGV